MPVLIANYQSYLDGGGTEEYLVQYCIQNEMKFKVGRQLKQRPAPPGSIYRIVLPSPPNQHPFRIRVLKLAEGEYRFGHTHEELEAVRVLHGLPDNSLW